MNEAISAPEQTAAGDDPAAGADVGAADVAPPGTGGDDVPATSPTTTAAADTASTQPDALPEVRPDEIVVGYVPDASVSC